MKTLLALLALSSLSLAHAQTTTTAPPTQRNVILFIADGLRPNSVNDQDAPTLSRLRREGVNFVNSHSLFPTFTTPNASAIATGHYLGDTGDFSNGLYTGYRVFNAGNFGRLPATSTPFIENDLILGDLNDHFEGNYLGEESLLAVARANGYSTAAIGKLGPVAIQDVTQLMPKDGKFGVPDTVIIDDVTGTPEGVPLSAELLAAFKSAGLPAGTPTRIQPTGDSNVAGIRSPNWGQQTYFIEATTRAVLPTFKKRGKPFVLVYWSRDPDGTQHNQGDSLNRLSPGINGPTSRAAIRNMDNNLQQLLEAIRGDPALANSTDVFVTSDHGFATISKRTVDAQRTATTSFAATVNYEDVPQGFLPPGFLAIDLAEFLQQPLFDPDSPTKDAHGNPIYQRVAPKAKPSTFERQHPAAGNGLIGGSGKPLDDTDADIVVTVNGGSDLIYLPHGDAARARRLVDFLATRDYVGALFVDDQYGEMPGALRLSDIALVGESKLPRPAIVVGFKTFALYNKDAGGVSDPLLNAVQIADTPLQQGQGMHGSFGRDNTFNFMAAIGPDFKAKFQDALPASNADIAPTLAKLLQLSMRPRGILIGRTLDEALRGGASTDVLQRCLALSAPATDGRRTVMEFQRYQERMYFDQAAFRAATKDERAGCR